MRAGGSAVGTPTPSPREPFKPTKLEIMGYISDWSKREDEGILQAGALQWILALREALPRELADVIDEEATAKACPQCATTDLCTGWDWDNTNAPADTNECTKGTGCKTPNPNHFLAMRASVDTT